MKTIILTKKTSTFTVFDRFLPLLPGQNSLKVTWGEKGSTFPWNDIWEYGERFLDLG